MKVSQGDYSADFFNKFVSNEELARVMDGFAGILGQPTWWALDRPSLSRGNRPIREARRCGGAGAASGRNKCSKAMISSVKKASSTRRPVIYKCPYELDAITIPLIQGDKILGYISICNIRAEEFAQLIEPLKASIGAVMGDVKKELELSKLYDTIRPRAIALSTIHTVHRILSSTLNLDELLPKVGRLCLQVLRGKICHIMLLDEAKKYLISKAFININKKAVKARRNVRLGEGIEGKVAETGQAILKASHLSVPLIDEDVIGVLSVSGKAGGRAFSNFDQEILATLAEQTVVAIKNAQLYEEQEKTILGSVKSLSMALEAKTPTAYTHCPAFVDIVVSLAKEMGLDKRAINSIYCAALLHDAGKLGIPDEVLRKKTGLSHREYRLIQKHPIETAKVLKPMEALAPAVPIILHHHERYDGTGYPSGLKAEEIPIAARIMAVATAFDAMVCKRPYRHRAPLKEAVSEIKRNAGTQFDPQVVEAFIRLAEKGEIKRLLKKGGAYGVKKCT